MVTLSLESARRLSDVIESVRRKSHFVLPMQLANALTEAHGVLKAAVQEAEACELVGSLSLEV